MSGYLFMNKLLWQGHLNFIHPGLSETFPYNSMIYSKLKQTSITWHHRPTPYHIPHTTYHTYHIPHTTYHIPHTIYHIPHTTYHIPHTMVYSIGRTWSWLVMSCNACFYSSCMNIILLVQLFWKCHIISYPKLMIIFP